MRPPTPFSTGEPFQCPQSRWLTPLTYRFTGLPPSYPDLLPPARAKAQAEDDRAGRPVAAQGDPDADEAEAAGQAEQVGDRGADRAGAQHAAEQRRAGVA